MSPKGDQAGRSAQEHFNELYKPWRKKFRRRFSIVLAAAVGMVLPLGLLFPKFALLYWVLLAGTLFGTYASMADSPPEWIDNWRRGAEGERKTAKRLKKLPTGEWRVLHDLIPGDWNIDHIAVGRSGVYLLDSKALRGEIHIDGETLTAKRGSFDVDHWSNDRIGASINRRARRIRHEIRERSRANPWVTAVVVLWAEFPQRVAVGADGVVYVHGEELVAWMLGQERRLSPAVPNQSGRRC